MRVHLSPEVQKRRNKAAVVGTGTVDSSPGAGVHGRGGGGRGPRAGRQGPGGAEVSYQIFSSSILATTLWVCVCKHSQIHTFEMCALLCVYTSINYNKNNWEKVELECFRGWAHPGSPHTPLLPTARPAKPGTWPSRHGRKSLCEASESRSLAEGTKKGQGHCPWSRTLSHGAVGSGPAYAPGGSVVFPVGWPGTESSTLFRSCRREGRVPPNSANPACRTLASKTQSAKSKMNNEKKKTQKRPTPNEIQQNQRKNMNKTKQNKQKSH